MLTKEQFIEKSRENSESVTEKLLELGAVPIPCNCDYSGCEGWSWQPLSGLPGKRPKSLYEARLVRVVLQLVIDS
jgi:hypothetical protein